MTAEEFVLTSIIKVKSVKLELISENDALEAVDKAKREIAWNVHKMICSKASIDDIDHYVCGICDY